MKLPRYIAIPKNYCVSLTEVGTGMLAKVYICLDQGLVYFVNIGNQRR